MNYSVGIVVNVRGEKLRLRSLQLLRNIKATNLTITSQANPYNASNSGGIVGKGDYLLLSNVSTTAGTITFSNNTGGIVGSSTSRMNGISISATDLTLMVDIQTNANLGGIVGYLDIADITLTTSYVNAGISSASTSVGMIYAGTPLNKSFTNIYYNFDGLNSSNINSDEIGITGLPTTSMQCAVRNDCPVIFTGFDFINIWSSEISRNEEMPILMISSKGDVKLPNSLNRKLISRKVTTATTTIRANFGSANRIWY